MSKRGPSRRERQLQAIFNLLREPPFTTRQAGRWYIVEPSMARLRPSMEAKQTDMMTFHQFEDLEEARVFRAGVTAEAILDAIEKETRK